MHISTDPALLALLSPRMWWTVLCVTFGLFCLRIFTVPSHLRHLPRAPILPLLWSYLTGEVEDSRIRRLILPHANDRGEGIILVWALGRWMIHILDLKIAQTVLDNPNVFPKERPPDSLLLWRFVGTSSILLANGDVWKKQSRLIHDAFSLSLPIDQFVATSRNLLSVIGGGTKTLSWDDLAQRFALDALGSTILGYDFDAIRSDTVFMKEYNGIMHDIANPIYLIAPFLERLLPRKSVIRRIDALATRFKRLLAEKKTNPGDDMMTFMLKDPEMSEEELRDNMILLFIAGHDTSAGALSTLVYFLAVNPSLQDRARTEVLSILGPAADPTIETMQGSSMPFLGACIREALRINTSISYIVPRAPLESTQLGKYAIPGQTSLVVNIYSIHHNEKQWPQTHVFQPERFMKKGGQRLDWVPFSLGPRQCPARNFALYEQRVLVAMLLREYTWTLPASSIHKDGLKNGFSPFALTLPAHLDIVFTKREGNNMLF